MSVSISHMESEEAVGPCTDNMSNDCHCHESGLVLVSNTDYALVFLHRQISLRSSVSSSAGPLSAHVAFIGLVFVCRHFALRPPASAAA